MTENTNVPLCIDCTHHVNDTRGHTCRREKKRTFSPVTGFESNINWKYCLYERTNSEDTCGPIGIYFVKKAK